MKIAVFGAGNMGGAIVKGLLTAGVVEGKDLMIFDPKLDEFCDVMTQKQITSELSECDIVLLAVKPWLAKEVLESFMGHLNSNTVLCSVVAGLSTEDLTELSLNVCPVVRIMPNTAVSTGEGMTFYCVRSASDEQKRMVDSALACTGKVMEIEERLMNGCMAMASCGIAFALRYIRASVEGGVELGVPSAMGVQVMAQTLRGAASLLENGSHPEQEIDKVTTPGGITIKGLNAMECNGFTRSVIEGLRACVK